MKKILVICMVFLCVVLPGVSAAGSLTDNGNGTVTDSGTHLTWQQGENSNMTWEAALTYCEGLSLAAQTDWRLPNSKELLSLVDYTRYNPSINTTFFPGTTSSYYWSSTTNASSRRARGIVHFGYGGSASHYGANSYYVRCVAAGSLADNGNGTVTDSGTHLTWQQGENSNMTWEAALTYCEGLSLAAQTDWRLPNYKELLSLVDYTRYNPSINTTFFPGTTSSSYWSSTTSDGAASNAWVVSFGYGDSGHFSKTYWDYVRCVRGGQ